MCRTEEIDVQDSPCPTMQHTVAAKGIITFCALKVPREYQVPFSRATFGIFVPFRELEELPKVLRHATGSMTTCV